MKNDNIETTNPKAGAFGITRDTCVYCGDPTPDLICPDCEKKNEADAVKQAQDEADRVVMKRRAKFRDAVGDYFETDIDRLPDTAAKRAAMGYIIGGRPGLTISGPGDTGKTRSAVWIARKEMEAGRWVEFRQCGELRQELLLYARNGLWESVVRPLTFCDVLILDDFGNHEFTRVLEEALLTMLERRTKKGHRTFITTQYDGKELKALFTTPQMADAVLRRVGRQYATTVSTKENTITLPQ